MINSVLNIVIRSSSDFNTILEGTQFTISVFANYTDGTSLDVTSETSILSLDNNFMELPHISQNTFLAYKEGSGYIKAIYIKNTETFSVSKQFICYNSFFKDNYLTYLFPSLDAGNIRNHQRIKITFDTLMEMLDILYAYNNDLSVISNFRNGKSQFLSLASQNVGFERFDYSSFNTAYEEIETQSFRELVSNIIELLSVRGTRLAYEIFFRALGYFIELQEFWYDVDGNLIEINPTDESKSTFFAYNTYGELIDPIPYPRRDPRYFFGAQDNSKENLIKKFDNESFEWEQLSFDKNNNIISNSENNFKNNKSNYVRISIKAPVNENVFQAPENFSLEKKIAIKKYLEYLRPQHIQYIDEAFGQRITTETLWSFQENFIAGLLNQNKIGDELLDQILEKFISSPVKNIYEELSSANKWDKKLRWDSGLKYDYKTHLVEVLTWTREINE
jgi:hypothetical protein